MAFNGNQSAFADSLFRQAGGNLGAGNSSSATMPVFSIPNALKQDQHTTSFVPWTHDSSRKPTDTADFDWETDLQGLVSNIVEEADSSDGCLNEGLPPMCNSIWSPKTSRKEPLQCPFDAKAQQNPPFPPNNTSHNGFSGAQEQSMDEDVEGLHQCLNGLAQQWLLNGPNGDSHSSSIQKQPQGLPNANRENIFWPQQSKYDNNQPMSGLPDLGDAFIPPHEMNGSCLGPFYEEHCVQSSVKPAYHEPYTAEDVNQLMRHLQSLACAERLDSLPNLHKQTAGLNRDDNVAEPWKTSSSAVHIPTQSGGEMKPVWREHNGGMKKQTLKREVFQDAPDFSPQNSGSHQQPKSGLSQVNFLNQNQKKILGHGDNFHVNGYWRQHSQLKQMQSNIRPQMQKEKHRMLVDGFRGGSSPIGAQTNTPARAGVNRSISQDPYLDFHGSVQPPKFDGENGNYPVNNLRRPPRTPSNYNALPYGSGVSGLTPGDMMPASEAVSLNYFGRRGENMHQMTALTVANWGLMNQGGPVVQFPVYLDECYEQWRRLENERLMAEGFLMKTFRAQKSPTGSNSTLPKMSPTPAIISQLLINQMREQTKVASLLHKIECVHRLSLHANIHSALSRHFTAVCVLLERRKEADLNKLQQRPRFTESKDAVLMDVALKELAAATRRLRAALWCSLQMIIPFPVKTQDQHVSGEDGESGAPPCQGYSFNK